mgnify:CR=1 FL=1
MFVDRVISRPSRARKAADRSRLAQRRVAPLPPRQRIGLVSRSMLLAGTSTLALLLTGLEDASARPFGNFGAINSAPTIASDGATAAAQQATEVARQSQGALTRASQAIQALQAAQSVARGLAASAPSAVLLGADGQLAGGPVNGGNAVIEFVQEICEQPADTCW